MYGYMSYQYSELLDEISNAFYGLVSYWNFTASLCSNVGQDSSVAEGTRYGLDGSGIESRWR